MYTSISFPFPLQLYILIPIIPTEPSIENNIINSSTPPRSSTSSSSSNQNTSLKTPLSARISRRRKSSIENQYETKTKLFVSNYNEWRKENKDSKLYNTLCFYINEYIKLFSELVRYINSNPIGVSSLTESRSEEDNVKLYFSNLKEEKNDLIKEIQCKNRLINFYYNKLGIESNTEIVPSSQFEIISKLYEYNTVLSAGVPGAGGYDGIYIMNMGKINEELIEYLYRNYSLKLLNVSNNDNLKSGIELESSDF